VFYSTSKMSRRQQKKKGQAAPQKKAANQKRSAKRAGKQQQRQVDPASHYMAWAQGKHNLPPRLPVSSGPRQIHHQTVTFRLQLVPTAKSCGVLFSKDSAHTNSFTGTGGLPSVANIQYYQALTAGVPSGMTGVTAHGQYTTGTNDNGTGFSKFEGGTISWRSADSKLNVGGSVFLCGGRDLSLLRNNAGTVDIMPEADLISISMSREHSITQAWQSVRVVPTAPDQFAFRDIPELIGGGSISIGEYLPDSFGEFVDRGVCEGLIVKTAATASPVEILLELHYSNCRYSPNSTPPVITRGTPNELVPAAPNVVSRIQNAITQMSNSTESGGMPSFSRAWSELSHGQYVKGLEDAVSSALPGIGMGAIAGAAIDFGRKQFGGLLEGGIPRFLGSRVLPMLL
jgi:hypothetical protein